MQIFIENQWSLSIYIEIKLLTQKHGFDRHSAIKDAETLHSRDKEGVIADTVGFTVI